MAIDTSQLPPGAQISYGNTGKTPVGVLEEGFAPEGAILARQAQQAAALRGLSMPQTPGAQLDADVLERVQTFQGINPMIMNRDTLEGVVKGDITRDQAFVGNNANFTGYYLEPAAKYVIPQYTPVRNTLPRLPGLGIDTINWRAITESLPSTTRMSRERVLRSRTFWRRSLARNSSLPLWIRPRSR